MPRARNIKPSFFRNEILSAMPATHRLLFIGLWTEADRDGRLEDRPARLKLALLPLDDVDIGDALDDLDAAGFIRRYAVDGRAYIQVTRFTEHQTPHHKETTSVIPPLSDGVATAGKVTAQVRETVLQRDGCACVHCRSTVDLWVTHVVPRWSGGTDQPDNLQTLCARCVARDGGQSIDHRRADSMQPISTSAENDKTAIQSMLEPSMARLDVLIPDSGTLIPDSYASNDACDAIPPVGVQSQLPGLGLAVVKTSTKGCPIEAIATEYNARCKQLPPVRAERLRSSTAKSIQARWREDQDRRSLRWWCDYFDRVAASQFLTGGRTDFRATLDWLVGPKNMAKVLDGAYDPAPGAVDQLLTARARRQWGIVQSQLSNPAEARIDDDVTRAVLDRMGGLRRLSRLPRYDLQAEAARFLGEYVTVTRGGPAAEVSR